MRRLPLLFLPALGIAATVALFPTVSLVHSADGVALPAGRSQVTLGTHTFTLPEGFEIELAAGPPLVNRPIVADFDEQGRLYVSDSSGSNEAPAVQLKKKPHRIVRLEDTKGDGRFDKAVVFADRMMFPEGAMWLNGSLYVAAPPSIWKLTDTTGQGIADRRSEWFQGKTIASHGGNDLHGPYAGPDGWIYWCKGGFGRQTYERPGRKPFVTRAAHIFRCRPDGTGVEAVMNGGMDNPVEVAFTPGGERLFTTTFVMNGTRDGLIHFVYGGLWGKDHGPIYEHPWTGPTLMPVLAPMGPAAPSGLARYQSGVFGPEYQDNFFATQFNLNKVSRHILTPSGATFTSRDEDFLVSSNRDFHPTHVLEDADGSLLVIDTGGWYKLACPTSQFHKPDILGAIYRIRRKGSPKFEDPRGLKLTWNNLSPAELAKLLGDARPAVRKRAIATLAAREADALPALKPTARSSSEARRNAVWCATRIDHAKARAFVRRNLTEADETVRQVALHSISLWRDRDALPVLLGMLWSKSPQNRRAAAEALGRIGDKKAVPDLLETAGKPADRYLEHSLIYALIEIADPAGTAVGLKSNSLRIRRAAMIALDQMENGGLQASTVVAELTSPDAAMKKTASWIVGRHPEWGDALAGYFDAQLKLKDLPAAERDELVGHLARSAKTSVIQKLLAEWLQPAATTPDSGRLVLRAMAQSGLKEMPEAWLSGLMTILADNRSALLPEALATARALPVPKGKAAGLSAELLRIAGSDQFAVALRLEALAAVSGGVREMPPPVFTLVQAHVHRDKPVVVRALAVDVLARARLDRKQLLALAEALKTTGPMEVDRLLAAFSQTTDEEVGLRLLTVLDTDALRPGLRADTIKRHLAKYGPKVQDQVRKLHAALNVDEAKMKAKLEELLQKVEKLGGDERRGQAVFYSAKAACSACHNAGGYIGGNIGPNLMDIGKIRKSRDLLEAIIFPSASFVQGYEPVTVITKDGKPLNGLVRGETPQEILIVTGANQETRIRRDDIEEILPSKVSVMPAGLDTQLTPQELADLIVFLLARK